MRQHKVFLRHELLKYNSEKSTAKSSALENYISSANLSLSGCSSAEPNSVSVGRCKFQLKKLYLQTVKKVDHLPLNFCVLFLFINYFFFYFKISVTHYVEYIIYPYFVCYNTIFNISTKGINKKMVRFMFRNFINNIFSINIINLFFK